MKSTYVNRAFSTSTHILTFLLPWESLATISTTQSHNFLHVWARAGGCGALDWIKSEWQRPRGAGAESRSWVIEGCRFGGPDRRGRGGKRAQDRTGSKNERSLSRDPRTGQRGSGVCVKTKSRTSKQSETWARTDAHQVPFSLRPGKPYDRCRG